MTQKGDGILNSLLDQLKNLLNGQIAALASFSWAIAWATAQNFFDRLSAPSIVGPGKADILRYGMNILQADNSKEACKAAADGIYNLLLPNFGGIMEPSVSSITNIIGTGDAAGNAGSSNYTSRDYGRANIAGQTNLGTNPHFLDEGGELSDDENQ